MARYLGIDTSNYTTSVALYNSASGEVWQRKQLLPVKDGALGLRQSDAVFSHVKQLGALIESLFQEHGGAPDGIGVSVRPRDAEGSYMPCFLVGETAARCVAAVCGVPLSCVSHQAGHIAAALYSTGRLDLIGQRFAAFHLSGGTTECVIVQPRTGNPLTVNLFAQSLDLKAGQAVDRVGGMLGLPFPAGPRLEELARQSKKTFRIKAASKGADCSLSGIENKCRSMLDAGEAPCDVARFCLDSILAALTHMTVSVRNAYGEIPLVYAGGVMSNAMIRTAMETRFGGLFAQPQFSADNAAGTAVLARVMQEDSV